jgi:hypothetical protein
LKDTKALFHVDHSNLGTGVLNSANLGVAKTALSKIAYGGKIVGSSARFLIVPTDLEDLAKQLCYSVADVSSNNANVVNPHKGIQVVATNRLTDVNDWYLAGAKGRTIVRAYLNGNRTPQLKIDESRGTEALGFTFRIIFDVGIGVRSPFYLYKSANV